MDNSKHDPFGDNFEEDPFVEDHFGSRTPPQGARVEQLPDSTAVLVLGILSILGAFCYGVIGLILGIISVAMSSKPERLYRQEPNRYTSTSYSNMRAGKVCGIIGLCLSALIILLIIVVFISAYNESRW